MIIPSYQLEEVYLEGADNKQLSGGCMYDIFLSHSREQKKDIAIPLAEELMGVGFHVWIDKRYIQFGSQIYSNIEAAIDNSYLGVVIASGEFIKKDWPMYELKRLYEKDIESILLILYSIDIDDISTEFPALHSIAYERWDPHDMTRIVARVVASYYAHKMRIYGYCGFDMLKNKIASMSTFSEHHRKMLWSLIDMYINCYNDTRSKAIALYNLIGYIKGISDHYHGHCSHELLVAYKFVQKTMQSIIPALDPLDYDIFIAIENAAKHAIMTIAYT